VFFCLVFFSLRSEEGVQRGFHGPSVDPGTIFSSCLDEWVARLFRPRMAVLPIPRDVLFDRSSYWFLPPNFTPSPPSLNCSAVCPKCRIIFSPHPSGTCPFSCFDQASSLQLLLFSVYPCHFVLISPLFLPFPSVESFRVPLRLLT